MHFVFVILARLLARRDLTSLFSFPNFGESLSCPNDERGHSFIGEVCFPTGRLAHMYYMFYSTLFLLFLFSFLDVYRLCFIGTFPQCRAAVGTRDCCLRVMRGEIVLMGTRPPPPPPPRVPVRR